MQNLSTASLAVADDLRRAERSINLATRDTAQFLVSTLEAASANGLSAAMSHGTVKATIATLAALAESQTQLAMRAHVALERAGRQLGLSEDEWGGGAEKPPLPVAIEDLSVTA